MGISTQTKKRIVLLGSTGSIGQSALRIARHLPEHLEIVGLAAGRNARALAAQAEEFGVRHVALYHPENGENSFSSSTEVYRGEEGLTELLQRVEADMVLIAIVGTAGLQPALTAIDMGMDIALASKEILVMAGELVTLRAQERGVRLLPVDSEHNALFQCLENRGREEVARLVLTASGGPFRTWDAEKLAAVTPEQALRHPTWEMGRKISIDSATLFNKGLEMIEAHWLFGVAMDRIDVVVHPQSIVHSLVEFVDGSMLAQLSHNDMGFPIQYALMWPRRLPSPLPSLDLAQLGKLEFERPRGEVFPALRLARWAGDTGGTLPAVFNAANEVAVEAFLQGQIAFPEIWQLVEECMKAHQVIAHPSLDAIVEADRSARREVAAHLDLLKIESRN